MRLPLLANGLAVACAEPLAGLQLKPDSDTVQQLVGEEEAYVWGPHIS